LSVTVDQPAYLDSAGQPEPPALILNEPSCYHFRAFDPRLPLSRYPVSVARDREKFSWLIREAA